MLDIEIHGDRYDEWLELRNSLEYQAPERLIAKHPRCQELVAQPSCAGEKDKKGGESCTRSSTVTLPNFTTPHANGWLEP